METLASRSKEVFKGVMEDSVLFSRRRLASEFDNRIGEDDNWRDRSTGGNERLCSGGLPDT